MVELVRADDRERDQASAGHPDAWSTLSMSRRRCRKWPRLLAPRSIGLGDVARGLHRTEKTKIALRGKGATLSDAKLDECRIEFVLPVTISGCMLSRCKRIVIEAGGRLYA